jgi:TolB protein
MTRTSLVAGFALLACAAPSSATAEPVNGRIAYSTFESSPTGSTGDIWTMEADGGGKQQAVFHPDNDAQADWAPDGTKIVYRSRRANQFEISIVDFTVRDPTTGRPAITDIPRAPDGTQSSQPALVPRHERAVVPAHERRRDHRLRRLDDEPRRQQSPPARRAAPGPVLPGPLARHDEAVVLDHCSGRRPQHPGDDRGDGRHHHAARLQRRSDDSAPAWSPDGRQIAFESDLDGDREIYVTTADGSNVRQITHNTRSDEGPAWSPDGKQFAFSSGAGDLVLDIR